MLLILIYLKILIINAKETINNLTDTNLCKLSHLGLDYLGLISKTESLVRCQSWNTNKPHETLKTIKDINFPEGTKELAKNYCRNPNKDPKGPWCYTLNDDLINETCSIPLCSFSQCKLTGPGMEYSGEHSKTITERKCLKWNKNRKIMLDGRLIRQDKYEKIFFPELDLSKAGKKCRNPDGDIAGPWCYVENEKDDTIEKDYCEIPFCDEPVCVVFTKNYETYMHYTDFNDTLDSLNFGIKLWSSDDYLDAEARLILSIQALPMSKIEMEDFGISIEILITNKHSGLTVNNKDEIEYEQTKGILKSTEYTYFTLSWHKGFITLNKIGVNKPIFLAEYKTKNNLLGHKLEHFFYYSAQGTNILWTFPFCLDDYECDVHTTTGHLFQQYWPLRDNKIGRELIFHVRAFHSAKILLKINPIKEFPNVLIHFKAIDGYTRVILKEHKNSTYLTLKELILTDVLDYWKWQEYSISFFGDTFQIHWTKNIGVHLLMEIRNEIFKKFKWFSVSSENTVAHWTFFCYPPENSKPPPAFLPECSMSNEESNYFGTQDITYDGLPCLPWSAKNSVPEFEINSFGNIDLALNELSYCRDPGNYHKGTYCYAISMLPEKSISKKYCHIRKCKSQECRMAGTGNDYTGTLNITRSRRYCEPWYSQHQIHQHDMQYMNASLYPDLKFEDARNFCRNPSRNPIGSWCYTIDPSVQQESCSVKDCDKPEECTIILVGKNDGRKVYILPKWKEKGTHGGLSFSLKQWNPDFIEGLSIEITPKTGSESIRLDIGANGNEKIILYLNGNLIKEKTLPHLISSGTWTDFWLQIRQEEIMLGYKGVPNSLFEWKQQDLINAFDPTFISFSTLTDRYLGIFYKCDECHTEYVSINNALKLFPLGIWSNNPTDVIYLDFSINIRGSGIVWLPLYNLIHTGNYLLLELNQFQNRITLHKFSFYQPLTLKTLEIKDNLIDEKYWTNYVVQFNETTFNLIKNETLIFNFETNEPILIYYFTLGVDNGLVTWSVNCKLLDLDGPPIDGGWSKWSDWTCSVPCGGGDGFKTRTCTNPSPNINGKLCIGTPIKTGKCNEFDCGDLSPKTIQKIRDDLRNRNFNIVVSEDTDVKIPNNNVILKDIRKESPKSYYEWSINGMLVNEEPNRIVLKNDNIFILKVKPEDSGIYVCILYRIDKKRMIIRVVSLAVIPNTYTITTRATKRLNLNCRSVILGYVYSDLSLKITINKTVYKNYGIVMLAAANTFNIHRLDRNFTGDWSCIVEQKDLNFIWTTNYHKILVKKAPNLYTNLLEDKLTKPLFGWLKSERNVLVALIVIISSTVIIVTLCLAIYFTFFTFKRRSYKRNRRL